MFVARSVWRCSLSIHTPPLSHYSDSHLYATSNSSTRLCHVTFSLRKFKLHFCRSVDVSLLLPSTTSLQNIHRLALVCERERELAVSVSGRYFYPLVLTMFSPAIEFCFCTVFFSHCFHEIFFHTYQNLKAINLKLSCFSAIFSLQQISILDIAIEAMCVNSRELRG